MAQKQPANKKKAAPAQKKTPAAQPIAPAQAMAGAAHEKDIPLLPLPLLSEMKTAFTTYIADWKEVSDAHLTPLQRKRKIGAGA